MTVFKRNKTCNECPFRADALPGWLGPLTIDEIETMVREDHDLVCHMDINRLMKKGLNEDQIAITGQHCVGLLRYMNSVCKLSRDPEKSAAQKLIRTIPDRPMIAAFKFREHHEQSLLEMRKAIKARSMSDRVDGE